MSSLSLLHMALLFGTTSPDFAPTVSVIIENPVQRQPMFDPTQDRPAEMPELRSDQVSATTCDFWCKPFLSYRIRSTSLDSAGCTAVIDVAAIETRFELTATSWLPTGAIRYHVQHEQAHRAICTRIHEESLESVRRATEEMSAVLTGRGADCVAAVDDAVARQATLRYCTPFVARNNRAARRIADLFEWITKDGVRAPSSGSALDAAFRQFAIEERESSELGTELDPTAAPSQP